MYEYIWTIYHRINNYAAHHLQQNYKFTKLYNDCIYKRPFLKHGIVSKVWKEKAVDIKLTQKTCTDKSTFMCLSLIQNRKYDFLSMQ